jgi:hypothetical protein
VSPDGNTTDYQSATTRVTYPLPARLISAAVFSLTWIFPLSPVLSILDAVFTVCSNTLGEFFGQKSYFKENFFTGTYITKKLESGLLATQNSGGCRP